MHQKLSEDNFGPPCSWVSVRLPARCFLEPASRAASREPDFSWRLGFRAASRRKCLRAGKSGSQPHSTLGTLHLDVKYKKLAAAWASTSACMWIIDMSVFKAEISAEMDEAIEGVF